MWKNALFATATIITALMLFVVAQLEFLIPYKQIIVAHYLTPLGVYTCLLGINLYALCFLISRKLLLKDTGRKLLHIERQLREGSIVHELSERLNNEDYDASRR